MSARLNAGLRRVREEWKKRWALHTLDADGGVSRGAGGSPGHRQRHAGDDCALIKKLGLSMLNGISS